MAHFAKIDSNNIVTDVIVAEQDFVDTLDGTWIQTSYNTYCGKHWTLDENQLRVESADQSKALRKNFAGIGMTYDSSRDAFISPKPFPSWVLNETTCVYEAPVAVPDDSKVWEWNETDQVWE